MVNWGKVFYIVWRERGEEAARGASANLARLPIDAMPGRHAIGYNAAQLKALHHIPYVDCIAADTAVLRDATLVTSDRDFEKLGRHMKVLWTMRR